MRKFCLMSALVCMVATLACSKVEDSNEKVVVSKREMAIGLPVQLSRTALNGERASWVEGDTFALWAKNDAGQRVIKGAPFTMMYYWDSYKSAVFTSQQGPIAEGAYTYYAVSPAPEVCDHNRYTATYTIPAEQQGASFNGAYDIMVAEPITDAAALVSDKLNDLKLDFHHKMHILKVVIAENNLGIDVGKLKFTFPSAVTGAVTVDVTNTEAAMTLADGSKELTIDCGRGLSVGEAAFGVIFPQTISGDIKLTAVGTDGRLSVEKTISLSKNCLAGHITPLSLTVPAIRSTLRFSIGKNNLGEDIQKLTIIDNNGASVEFNKSANNIYDFSVESSSATAFDHYEGKTFTARFESANAIVSTTFVMPTNLTSGVNVIPALTVPYLLFEDFSCIHTAGVKDGDDDKASSDRNQGGELLDGYMHHKGWNAARYQLGVGTCARLNVRHQAAVGFNSTHRGRLDTPPISCLKSGATVSIKIEFDAGAHVIEGLAGSGLTGYEGTDCTIVGLAKHTNLSNPINGVGTGHDQSGSIDDYGTSITSINLPDNYTTKSFGATFPTCTTSTSGVNKNTRLVFYPNTTIKGGVTGNAECFVYIDNIRVSIVQ